jgi:hypothetical protein
MTMRLSALFATIGGAVVMVVALALLQPGWAIAGAALVVGAGALGRVWSRKYPGPMPYSLRLVLLLPRGPHSPQHLLELLQPASASSKSVRGSEFTRSRSLPPWHRAECWRF